MNEIEIQDSRTRVRAAVAWYRRAEINVPFAHWYLQACKEIIADSWRIYRRSFEANHAGR